jgi:nucleotide-binding universal stress UspA family protein
VDILLCTDGSNTSNQSAKLLGKFRFPASTRVVVLGVNESRADVGKLTNSMDQIEKILGANYVISRKIRNGDPIEKILAEALESSYDLVVVGGGGKQLGLLHPQIGFTTAQLARKLHTHFLVSRNVPEVIGKVLVCTSADVPESDTMKLGGEWISQTPAKICLLHVVPIGRNEADIRRDAIPSHDLMLDRASKQLQDAGVKSEIITRIRHGLVVDEVVKELTEGEYELLIVGSHYQPGLDRWQGTLLDDITDQLLNRSTCSIFII